MSTYDRPDKPKYGGIAVNVVDDVRPISGAFVSLYKAPEGVAKCSDFDPARWQPKPSRHIVTLQTATSDDETEDRGTVSFERLEPDLYVIVCEHLPEQIPQCVQVKPRCVTTACFDLSTGVSLEVKYLTDECREIPCGTPRVGDLEQVTLKYKDAKAAKQPVTLTGPADAIEVSPGTYSRTLTSGGPAGSTYLVQYAARGPIPGFPGPASPAQSVVTTNTVAMPRLAQNIAGNMGVSLQRTAASFTVDVSHWQAILNSTDALSFAQYDRFMELVICGDRNTAGLAPFEVNRFGKKVTEAARLVKNRALPFVDTDAYRYVKVATEAFVMVNCGIMSQARPFADNADAAYLARRDVPFPTNGLDAVFTKDYLTRFAGGGNALTLPYLAVIRKKLGDIDINFSSVHDFPASQAIECYGILQEKLTNPCLLELIWSYWHEEGMLVQTMNAVTRRFQNVRGSSSQDPLANLEIDPLRPLNNLLWGYVQDEQHRLTVVRRNYEYNHQYGIRLDGKAVQGMAPADTRSKFLEAFHNLLRLCTTFFRQDDDTTIKADAFPVLNALKEVHLILTEGQHNQFGDLTSTARVEMMMQQWLLGRPEFREFLPTRISVAYPERWMDRVDAMKKLQAWTDTSCLHFRNLAIFGEQILLGIRWGFWSDVQEPEQAFNWARLFRPQIQGYIHAYRAVAGVDLAAETVDTQVDSTMPSTLLRRRLTAQQHGA